MLIFQLFEIEIFPEHTIYTPVLFNLNSKDYT